jgi:hypothetical protein
MSLFTSGRPFHELLAIRCKAVQMAGAYARGFGNLNGNLNRYFRARKRVVGWAGLAQVPDGPSDADIHVAPPVCEGGDKLGQFSVSPDIPRCLFSSPGAGKAAKAAKTANIFRIPPLTELVLVVVRPARRSF